MNPIRLYRDFTLLTLMVGGFLFVASQRLGTVPVPEGDEAYMSQVSYEMQYRGKIAVPMMRYLGGNIENAWHSRTPVYFLLLRGFTLLFGFGLSQGRAFNLITAALTLTMVYLLGRRMFDWRAGLAAIAMLAGDQVFLERSRLLRNDYAGASFALLAFYLYEVAEERHSAKYYAASGLAAGAGVMCHTNILYMVGAICLLVVLRKGWRAFSSNRMYVFAGSALLVTAYEIIYAIVDHKNFVLQNRGDEVHFRVFEGSGLWRNLLEERLRYAKWYEGVLMFPGLPQTTLRIFQLLTIAALIYLAVVLIRRIRRGQVLSDPAMRILVVTAAAMLFHALIVSQKRVFYLAHIVPWFALSVGVLLRDTLDRIQRLRGASWPRARLAGNAAMFVFLLGALGYTIQLATQSRRYLAEVRNPDLASFDEFTSVIRGIVPDGLCPVAVKNPSVWLAFPEKDDCFASIENRMRGAVDISGKDYALVTRLNARPEVDYHLLGEMQDTPYGNLMIYYTGSERRYIELAPKRYRFFGESRGHVRLD